MIDLYPMHYHGRGRDLHACHERVAGVLGAPTLDLAQPARLSDVVVALTGDTVTVTGTAPNGQPATTTLDSTAHVQWHTHPNGGRL
ncbi:hypothetical protein [Georgenia sp. MJ170]|uniref:hypothetical protein n=1 Tax=Georgenia sunbinii TaxID=3117728 RepID=UPI002F26CD72